MKRKSPDPAEMVVAEALRRFADVEVYEALNKLAASTLEPHVCRSQLENGLVVLLGKPGGGWIFGTLARFDSGAVHDLADRYCLEPLAKRNLSLYVARWSPILEKQMHGNRLRGCEAAAIMDDEGDVDYQLRMLAGDGQEIVTRLNAEVALDVVGKLLSCLARTGAPIPKEIDHEVIKKLRLDGPGDDKEGRND